MTALKNALPGRILPVILFLCISLYAFCQEQTDTTDGRFYDDLLNHLVGKWNVTSSAHGCSSNAIIQAEWTFSHQHLRVHFKGQDEIPWLHVPVEFEYYIGYKHNCKRYVVHAISVFGNDDYEGFCYAYRDGNEIKLLQKNNPASDTVTVQKFTWQPASNTWLVNSRMEIAGKEEDVFLEMKLVAAKTSPIKKKYSKSVKDFKTAIK